MAMTETQPFIHRVPLIGRIFREVEREPDAIWYILVAFLSIVIIGTKTFGLVFLAMTALSAVPVMFILLLLITRG